MGVTHGKKADHNHQNLNSGCAQPLMGPGESNPVSDFGFVMDSDQRWGAEEDFDHRHLLPKQTHSGYYDELIRPKKIPNPIKASKSHRELHRELNITQKRGVMEEKPELQKVLEQRNRIQALKQQKKQDVEKSPLKQELFKRQTRLEKLEREAEKQSEMSQAAPEFIRVKENLKSTAVISTVEKEHQLNISLH
ncbi:protein FAM107B isoform X1 [Triplophysa rosa]|uniref:protein FAM107B isoform X1 n=2 Tax=Triplophysa rosa TaxID=992332 RepID=UPI002545C8F5|nr:protein FAM107B isoform X1 [Triplophysa rosa]